MFWVTFYRSISIFQSTVELTYIELSLSKKSHSLKWISFSLQKWYSFLYKNARLNWNRLHWKTLLFWSFFHSAEHKLHCFYNGYIEVPNGDTQSRVNNYIKVLPHVISFTQVLVSIDFYQRSTKSNKKNTDFFKK